MPARREDQPRSSTAERGIVIAVNEPAPHSELPDGFPLDPASARIVGALIEKSMTTPDNYPLSLNAVTNACNQVSNREPVVDYSEDLVERTLRALADHGIASLYHKPGDRVVKYVHKLDRALEIGAPELSALAVLLLRGDQTPGELRQRTQRYGTFASLLDVEAALERLTRSEPPLVAKLARQPGQKEQRFRELVSTVGIAGGSPQPPAEREPASPSATNALESRVGALERRFESLLEQLGVESI